MKVQQYQKDFSYHCPHCKKEVVSLFFYDGDVFDPMAFLAIEEKGFSVYASRLFFQCENCKKLSEFVELFFMPKEGLFFEKGFPTALTNKYIFKNERLSKTEEPYYFLIENLFPLADQKTTVLQYKTPYGPLLEIWLGFFHPEDIYYSRESDKVACSAVFSLKNGFPLDGFKEGQVFEDWPKHANGFSGWFSSLENQYFPRDIDPAKPLDDVPF